jgi:AAA+ ATPase superfamily predicted ATPase
MKTFLGRETELALLDETWDSPAAQMLILYGRRRVGKTALLVHWMHQSRQRVLYWVATPSSADAQLKSFSQAVYNFAAPQLPATDDFTYGSWDRAWQQVAWLAQNERLALFTDEFTYLLEVTPQLAGQLQNFWDHTLARSNLMLVLCGSHLGMMKREFLSYQAPLYGRASAQIHLRPLPFGITRAYFPNYSAADRVALYSIFGGVPAYWERIDQRLSVSKNILRQLLRPNNLMQSEPRLLLQDFVSNPHNYVAILTAIAHEARTPKEIEAATGLPNVQVPKYLSVLAKAGFVERKTSITGNPNARSGRHHVIDPYLRFYYRFLEKRQDQIALGIQEQALAEISRHMVDFIGTHTWEELCQEWTLRAGAKGALPFLPDQVGSAWNRQVQIDVAGINRMEKTLILGECRWGQTAIERPVLSSLIEKAKQIVPAQGKWRVYFLGFSRNGWTSGAYALRDEVENNPISGNNWQSAGMRLLDLNQVDHDLEEWSRSADRDIQQ